MPSLMPLLEAGAADLLRDFVIQLRAQQPAGPAALLELGAAVASFGGMASPLNTVKGLGPRLRLEDLEAIEDFYRPHGMAPTLELAPWIEERDLAQLRQRGYSASGEEVVMLRRTASTPGGTASAPGGDVESMEDAEEWAALVCGVFGGKAGQAWIDSALALARIPGAQNLGLREDGRWVAAAQVVSGLRVATFACDVTAEEARGRGLQRRLIEARLNLAHKEGIQWSYSEVAPGSASQRNYLRCGFESVYTRTHWRKT